MENLTSVKLKPMLDMDNPELDLWCPYLNFGRKKAGQFKLPIVFKDYTQGILLHAELKNLVGKSYEEVRGSATALLTKYSEYDYRNKDFKIGDIVTPTIKSGYILASGSHIYDQAVVIAVKPFTLVSEDSTMKWTQIKKEDFEVIGKASPEVLEGCLTRLKH